nr:SDR family NAD(P)-dependent oxidoreductase [Edaphobacter bradus]
MSLANLFDLSGHVAVVTGGNGGIGRSIALGLAQAGAAVAVLARNEEKNKTVLGELKAVGSTALALSVDVTAEGQLQPALQQVEQTLGPVSVLVNNAGIAAFGKGVLETFPPGLGSGDRNQPQCLLFALEACGGVNGQAATRKNHQHRQHVCHFRRRTCSLLQRN